MNRGIAKRPLFEDRADYRFFLSRLAHEVRRGRLEVHAWCLLSTHFHLLVRSPVGDLSEALRRAQYEYSRFFNRRHRRDGTLFRGRFRSKRVESYSYRRNVVRYIDRNPVVARIVDEPWRYPWGSARQYVLGSAPRWLSRSWVESHVRAASEAAEYRADDYRRVFGSPRPGAERLVERRLESRQTGPDDADGLLASAPDQVIAWMRRKAALADGGRLGVPVCDPKSIRDVMSGARAEGSVWAVRVGQREESAWDLAEVGLLRALATESWAGIARALGRPLNTCHGAFSRHARLLESSSEYACRVGVLADEALRTCHGATP